MIPAASEHPAAPAALWPGQVDVVDDVARTVHHLALRAKTIGDATGVRPEAVLLALATAYYNPGE